MFNPASRAMTPWVGYRRTWLDPLDQMDRWMQSIDRYFDDRTGFQVFFILFIF
jgi:hypothetical protein